MRGFKHPDFGRNYRITALTSSSCDLLTRSTLFRHDDVCDFDLRPREADHFARQMRQLFCVSKCQNSVDREQPGKIGRCKRIRHLHGVRNSTGFNQQHFWWVVALQQGQTGGDQVVADVATDTAVFELDRIAFDPDHQLGVDIDGPEIIDQNTCPHTVIGR